MKTVTVNVMIQMDIPNKDADTSSEVIRILDLMNTIVGMSELESQPQIFTSDVDTSNIITTGMNFAIYDYVICPEPEGNDMWSVGGWEGQIEDIKTDTDGDEYASVRDGDGDVWDISLSRLVLSE